MPYSLGDVAATATLSSVAAATSSTTILAANPARKGAVIYNDSSAICYLALAATASTSAYSVQIPPQVAYELPSAPVYTGALSAVWSSATGAARCSEM
jgi:hypothetical protein